MYDPSAARTGKPKAELALFNLAIDSKLRFCDLVKLRVRGVSHGDRVAPLAIIMQQNTALSSVREHRAYPRLAIGVDLARTPPIRRLPVSKPAPGLFPYRPSSMRIVHNWFKQIRLDAFAYGTHTMRRTKAALIYRR